MRAWHVTVGAISSKVNTLPVHPPGKMSCRVQGRVAVRQPHGSKPCMKSSSPVCHLVHLLRPFSISCCAAAAPAATAMHLMCSVPGSTTSRICTLALPTGTASKSESHHGAPFMPATGLPCRSASQGAVQRVMVIDLDVHQGNGVERDKQHWNDSDLCIVDM